MLVTDERWMYAVNISYECVFAEILIYPGLLEEFNSTASLSVTKKSKISGIWLCGTVKKFFKHRNKQHYFLMIKNLFGELFFNNILHKLHTHLSNRIWLCGLILLRRNPLLHVNCACKTVNWSRSFIYLERAPRKTILSVHTAQKDVEYLDFFCPQWKSLKGIFFFCIQSRIFGSYLLGFYIQRRKIFIL